jgi:multiple sugar transport system permease protein
MSSTQQVAGFARQPAAASRSWRPPWHGGLRGSEISWAVAFIIPYAAVFLGFVVYPVIYGLWLGSSPELYQRLIEYPRYRFVVLNTVLLVGVAVNVKMFLAFLMSGFFIRRSRWIKALLVLYMLPWALPALPAYVSMHWMFIGYGGFLNSALEALFDVDGPIWFNSYWLALGANVLAYIWKWMPFWTLIFMAGRMAIPQDIYEAAEIDGASGFRRLVHVTFPLLANVYLICTLLSSVWTLGDFPTVYFVSSGAPARMTDVLATYGFHEAFDFGYPNLGVAAMMSALPLLVPLVILLMRRIRLTGVQL